MPVFVKGRSMPSRDRVQALIAMVEQGRYDTALETFYTEDASMQENLDPPRRGLKALVEGERRIMAGFRQIRTRKVTTFFVEGDRAAINWVFDFVGRDGSTFT